MKRSFEARPTKDEPPGGHERRMDDDPETVEVRNDWDNALARGAPAAMLLAGMRSARAARLASAVGDRSA